VKHPDELLVRGHHPPILDKLERTAVKANPFALKPVAASRIAVSALCVASALSARFAEKGENHPGQPLWNVGKYLAAEIRNSSGFRLSRKILTACHKRLAIGHGSKSFAALYALSTPRQRIPPVGPPGPLSLQTQATRWRVAEGRQECEQSNLQNDKAYRRSQFTKLEQRMHRNKVIVVLANKIARVAWKILTKPGKIYRWADA